MVSRHHASRSGGRLGPVPAYKAQLRDPEAHDADAALNHAGFVTTLGLAGRENDFETYAERLFGHPPGLRRRPCGIPRVQGRLCLLMRTYLALAPDMRVVFRQDGLSTLLN